MLLRGFNLYILTQYIINNPISLQTFNIDILAQFHLIMMRYGIDQNDEWHLF